MRLALPDGTLLEDGDAVAHVLRMLPRGRALGRAAQLPVARSMMRSLYGLVASNRHHLARFVRHRPVIFRRPGEPD